MQKRKSVRTALIATCLLLLIGGTAVYMLFFASIGHNALDRSLYIDRDDTPDSVYYKINSVAPTRIICGFRMLSVLKQYQNHLRTGHYRIFSSDNSLKLFKRLYGGHQTPVRLVVPEVRTIDALLVAVASQLMADANELQQAVADSGFFAEKGFDSYHIPAFFIPNTYEVFWNIPPTQLLKRFYKEYQAFWSDHRRAQAKAQGLTPLQVSTLASIVGEETNYAPEMPIIAGLYLNRLRIDMPLQADPTIKYAWHDATLRRITQGHLVIDSPYNTYRHKGLPPGPIRIATIKAIESVLQPQSHTFLYMCAKPDLSGRHNFATTWEEHLRNARAYQQALNQLNIH